MKLLNKLKSLIISIIIAIAATSPATAESWEVSLLTCSPGEEVYELFGHTALRYRSLERKFDYVYSYGYFSFEQPNFIWRFIKGETDYLAGVVSYKTFIKEYSERGSGVTEQVLNLTPEQKEKLHAAVFNDCRSQEPYRYNYIYNNCTTRIIDKITEQLPTNDSIIFSGEKQAATIREAIEQHTASQPWTAFGINLLFGADVDEPATSTTLLFLPGYLQRDLSSAKYSDGTPVVSNERELLPNIEKTKTLNHFTPFNSALLLLLLTMIITLCEVRSRKRAWIYDVLLLTVQGTAGCVLLFLALFSQHPAVSNNYLIILLNPLPLLLIPFVIAYAIKKKEATFMWIEVVMATLFIVTAPFVPQIYSAPIFIFAIMLIVRSLFNIYRTRICDSSLY